MRVDRRLFPLALTVVLGGCAIYSPLPSGPVSDGGEKFRAEINAADWYRDPLSDAFIISRDGFTIDYILVKRDKLGRDLTTNKQRFTADMEPWALAELQLDILQSDMRVTDFRLLANRPVTISGQPGYCLEYGYTNHQGIGISGVRCGYAREKWMYHIVYEGLTEHYFDHNRAVFDHFLDTFKGL